MTRRKTGCRICGATSNNSLLCTNCRSAIARLLLRSAAVVAVLALACGGYLMLQGWKLPAQQRPTASQVHTTGQSRPTQHADTNSRDEQLTLNPATEEGTGQGAVADTENRTENRKAFSPDMFAPQTTDIAGRFVTAIMQDKLGNMWFGSEEYGVFRWTKDGELTQFTSKHGLGDDNGYALTADADNSIWVGTLNHGLSKYDGKAWTTYSLLDGLGGLHVYCLALGPDGKTIWCGHENGVSRFDGKVWKWFSLADGLPWREITTIAAAKDGTVWVGGAMGGLGHYDGRTWQRIAADNGLPDERINGLCLGRDGRLWIATCKGVGCYSTKNRRFEEVSPPEAFFGPDSYVTCVAEDRKGCMWFGSRRGGLVKHDPKANEWMRFTAEDRNLPDDYVACLYLARNGHIWSGIYGYGLCTSEHQSIDVKDTVVPDAASALRPSTSGDIDWARGETEAHEEAAKLMSTAGSGDGTDAAYLGEDWQTRGNWIGNYGRYFRTLAAMGYGKSGYIMTHRR